MLVQQTRIMQEALRTTHMCVCVCVQECDGVGRVKRLSGMFKALDLIPNTYQNQTNPQQQK